MIDALRELEDVKSAAAAAQARIAIAFDRARRQAEVNKGVARSQRGNGIGGEIALARRESPHRGGHLLGFARALVNELPKTLDALAQGRLNEWRATLIARETACLAVADRAVADAWISEHLREHPSIGDRQLVADVRRKVTELDQDALVKRRASAAGGRRVTLTPLPDGMVRLTGVLKLEEGVACYASLTKTADQQRNESEQSAPSGKSDQPAEHSSEQSGQHTAHGRGAGRAWASDPLSPFERSASHRKRGRGAMLADRLVELLTGRSVANPCGIELVVVITDEALLGQIDEPAHVNRYGPMPANWVRQLIANTADPTQQVAIRRLFRGKDRTIALESRGRFMTQGLKALISIRDQHCRTPWCEADIRHHDHVRDHAKGGKTSALNGEGLCERCNYTKQHPDWCANAHQDPNKGHTVTLTTPTGHTYTSTQPTGPGDSWDR